MDVLEWLNVCEKDAKKGYTAGVRRRSDLTAYFADITAEKVFKVSRTQASNLPKKIDFFFFYHVLLPW